MKFSKKFLQDEGGKTISDEIVGRDRWSLHYCRIFEVEGRFYRTYYSVGATEYQDEIPYECDEDDIEVEEVMPVERLVTVYEPVVAH